MTFNLHQRAFRFQCVWTLLAGSSLAPRACLAVSLCIPLDLLYVLPVWPLGHVGCHG